jgi:hypothetical protein
LTDVDGVDGFEATGEVVPLAQFLEGHRGDGDLGGRRGGFLLGLRAAGGQHGHGGQAGERRENGAEGHRRTCRTSEAGEETQRFFYSQTGRRDF